MNNATLSRIGTILFSLVMATFGVLHFMHASDMVGMVPKFLPGGVIWIYIGGAGLVLAAISFLLNIYSRLAGILLGVLLIIFVLTIHLPHHLNGDPTAFGQILKDTALAGGSLLIASRGK